MKYAPKKVFVLENGKYVEITYEEHTYRKETDEQYAERRFIPVQGYLIETDQQCYTEFYREVERRKYLQKLEIELNPLSLESLDKEENNGIDFIEAEKYDDQGAGRSVCREDRHAYVPAEPDTATQTR